MPAPKANVNTKFSVLNDQGEFEDYSPDKLNPDAPTFFVTHGFTGSAAKGQPWQKDMVESIEAQNNGANVIRVSWDAPLGSFKNLFTTGSYTKYEQSAANTQTVGQNLLDVITESNRKIDPKTTTLIGHSLGAQVSGWAGFKAQEQGVGKIGTIVGLDPARPSFQNTLTSQDPLIPGFYKSPHRLVSSDADRVIAIHTSKRFGYTKPVSGADGNDNALDIYVNGGSAFNNRQDFGGTKSHNYSHKFFQQLLDGEGFDQDRNKRKNSKPLSDLNNPIEDSFINNFSGERLPLASLNTILQGGVSGNSPNTNRGIVDLSIPGSNKSAQVAQIPDDLGFEATESDDVVAGTKGKDQIVGGAGNDTLTGLQAGDDLFGNEGNDLLYGGSGNDNLSGNEGDDRLNGGINDDTLNGVSGNDVLFGGKGDDQLFGADELVIQEDGSDRLIGVNPQDANPGLGEIDTLTGGLGTGTDVYALGNSRTNYYVNPRGDQTSSYALIENFELGTDKIEINSASQLVFRPAIDYGITTLEDRGIAIAVGTQGDPELIGVVQPPQDAPFSLVDLENSPESFVRV